MGRKNMKIYKLLEKGLFYDITVKPYYLFQERSANTHEYKKIT